MDIAVERPEEFGPGLDPELLALVQATAELELKDADEPKVAAKRSSGARARRRSSPCPAPYADPDFLRRRSGMQDAPEAAERRRHRATTGSS